MNHEIDDNVVSLWTSLVIGVVLVAGLACWAIVNKAPAPLCASACGSAGVARVTAAECVCREGE